MKKTGFPVDDPLDDPMAGAVLQRAERRARDAGNGEELQLEGLELSNGLAHVTCRGRGADGPSSYSVYIYNISII